MGIIGIFILIVLGLIMICKPKWMWKAETLFLMKTGEPSEMYLKLLRGGGIFFILFAAVRAAMLLTA